MIKIFDKDFLYEIVVPSAPTGEERYAAETLQKYLQEIAGGGNS